MNNLKHLSLTDGDSGIVCFAQVETFKVTAIESMPGRYLFTGQVNGIEIINSLFVTEVKDLNLKATYHLPEFVGWTIE